jgi:hypothetical protein
LPARWSSRPSDAARETACALLFTPSFAYTWRLRFSTVRGLILNKAAIGCSPYLGEITE